MLHTDDRSHIVTVQPPLAAGEVELVRGLAGIGPGPRWVWPGQPGRRSPWLPCADGGGLALAPGFGADGVGWLGCLVGEVLAPAAREPRDRARRLGLPGGHRMEGEVLLDGVVRPRLLVAVGRRVRVVPLDEDPISGLLAPVEREQRRGRGEVVELTGRPATSEQRSARRRDQTRER